MIIEEAEKKSDPEVLPPAAATSANNGHGQNQFSPGTQASFPNPNGANAELLAAATALLANNPLLAAQLQQQQQQQQLLLQQQAAAALLQATTHNLIPQHLQAGALAASLNGTPGYQPALIPPPALASLAHQIPLSLPQQQQLQQALSPAGFSLPTMTVQDVPCSTPVYNGVNPKYPGLRVLNANPPVFAVDNFLTPLECQFLVAVAADSFGPAPVVGKGAGEVSPSRTSSTCYLSREDLPDLMRKVSVLTGKPIEHCELPQVGRYLPSQQYLQHFDAFDTSNEDGRRFAANGGQRTITVLIYLNDVLRGGATRFPALNLDVQPRQGMALIFFPATIDGYLDKMALHAAMPAVDTKYVSQVWIRQHQYNGQPSKRLAQIMGRPLGAYESMRPVKAHEAEGIVPASAF
ncbi:Probable prolyl 4-hydroxylase [Seminavis robusta]|uniref:Probable prolyl 4-hydroxylase n=1 Tax=Seminavis robusta TaxID=568900 RepID=A0A9N8E945_9STRA|nr:Probable prolyl 4-hydroxylase [Seminavis robusta]CAB9516293.1 Probable prolyl 4-hydroxylase [Seminavis robusta]|eukprot:Sro762_g198790.1 Probable prolyl 4-hydroxylase (407) ;mRNA; f:45066-46364